MRLVDLLVRQGRTEKALQFATGAQRKDLAEIIPKNEIKLSGKAAENLKHATVAENRITTVR